MLCLIMPLMLIGMQRVNAQTEPKVSPQLEELWGKLSKEQKDAAIYFAYSFIDENRGA